MTADARLTPGQSALLAPAGPGCETWSLEARLDLQYFDGAPDFY